jgi:hypothetical protein
LPATPSPTATVALSKVATISTGTDQSFYALAFTPVGTPGLGEALIGGDNNGEIWFINSTSGVTQDLGNFGGFPGTTTGQILALSGDLVFYMSTGDGGSVATGLATIRPCTTGTKGKCIENDDYLAGINMSALSTAYTSKTPATSLLGGIYGGSSKTVGAGTGYGEIYGLGAWEGNVYGFTRVETEDGGAHPPQLLEISTTSGAGKVISSSFGFTASGWSGAGVTTTVTITIPPPPPPPPQPPPPK